jgi:hypothetical protein
MFFVYLSCFLFFFVYLSCFLFFLLFLGVFVLSQQDFLLPNPGTEPLQLSCVGAVRLW